MAADFEKKTIPERTTVYAEYKGQKTGLGEVNKQVYAWVSNHHKDQVNQIWRCYSKRPAPDKLRGAYDRVEVEVRFDLPGQAAEVGKLPGGLKSKVLPKENVLTFEYRGPYPGAAEALASWMAAAEKKHKLRDGYRERIAHSAKNPSDPGWAVEAQVVLAA
jgi:effector-binding domain-containing protein